MIACDERQTARTVWLWCGAVRCGVRRWGVWWEWWDGGEMRRAMKEEGMKDEGGRSVNDNSYKNCLTQTLMY